MLKGQCLCSPRSRTVTIFVLLSALAQSRSAHADTPQNPAQAAAPDGPAKSGITMPRPRNYVAPTYPEEAQAQGLEGAVVLELDIDKNGRVTRAAVLEPAGHGFDEAALEAAKQLDFEPAKRADGTPFPARILYRFTFNLSDANPKTDAQGNTNNTSKQSDELHSDPLSGTVLSSGDDTPLAGVNLEAKDSRGNTFVVTTNTDGRFQFPSLAPGKVHLSLQAQGFGALELDEEIESKQSLEVKYRLVPLGGGLTVVVRGEKPPREITKRTLENREISRIPGTNGDALRSIQSLPGVARPPGLAGLLIVRGSAPQDTQAFVDGTPVPLIYHFGGLSSAIPTELLDRIDFYPGNFSAQYGRVMGATIDAAIRPIKTDGKYHGLAQIDLIDARAMLEGPIPGAPNIRFIAAGRRSHIDSWLGPVLESAGAGVTQAPVYYDYQFAIETNPSERSSFRVAFFGSDDSLSLVAGAGAGDPGLSGSLGFHTAFQRLQLRYTNNITENDKFTATVAFGRDDADFNIGAIYFYLDTNAINSRLEYSRRLGPGVTANIGADVAFGSYNSSFRGPNAPRAGEPDNQPYTTRILREGRLSGALLNPAFYTEFEITPAPGLKFIPGARFEGFSATSGWDAQPRFSARWDIRPDFPRTTLKGGMGVFRQPPQFFEALAPLGTPGLKTAQAVHYALGAEREISRYFETSIEGFYKQFDGLVVGTASGGGSAFAYRNVGTGYAVGTELLIKHKPSPRFFGWLAYTISRSIRKDGPSSPERLFESDQTHVMTVLGSYRLGHGFEIGARFRLVSGDIITPNVCDSDSEGCDPSRLNSLYHAPTGSYTPLPASGPYSERLPPFHQLDLRVDKKWVARQYQVSAYLDVQNVYNNGNAEGLSYNFNFTTRRYATGLPILPSIGVRGEF